MPSGNAGVREEARARARRVLPTPGGPVRVSSRTWELNSPAPAATSASLPMSGVRGWGRVDKYGTQVAGWLRGGTKETGGASWTWPGAAPKNEGTQRVPALSGAKGRRSPTV